jgi:hypothetical protein
VFQIFSFIVGQSRENSAYIRHTKFAVFLESCYVTLFDSVVTIRRTKMTQKSAGFQNFKEFVPQIAYSLINVALTMFDRLYYAI